MLSGNPTRPLHSPAPCPVARAHSQTDKKDPCNHAYRNSKAPPDNTPTSPSRCAPPTPGTASCCLQTAPSTRRFNRHRCEVEGNGRLACSQSPSTRRFNRHRCEMVPTAVPHKTAVTRQPQSPEMVHLAHPRTRRVPTPRRQAPRLPANLKASKVILAARMRLNLIE